MKFNISPLDEYSTSHTEAEPDYLRELNRKTQTEIADPIMLSGHLQGRFLKMLSQMLVPRRILEIGTYTGYSALCLAEGLAKDGVVTTIDINAELKPIVDEFIEKSGFRENIINLVGNAMDIIPQIDDIFDIVFIDADKENYINYYNLVFDKVRSGGYIIADNVLWFGKVLESDPDPVTQAIMEYNRLVHEDSRVEAILLPIRDGLMIARKK